MPEIISLTDDKTIPVKEGNSILEATLEAGVPHTHVCGGNARCSTCRVIVLEGLENCLPRNEKEQGIADRLGFPDHIRLACQTRITGDITIKRVVIDDLDIEIVLRQIGDKSGTQFGREGEIAILFFDLENHTQFVEEYPAYDVVHVLNRYYQTMNEIITFVGASHKILGYDLDSLLGRNDLEFVHAEDLPAVSAAFQDFGLSRTR